MNKKYFGEESFDISRDISAADRELKEAKKCVEELYAKRRLESEMNEHAEHAELTSKAVIDSVFRMSRKSFDLLRQLKHYDVIGFDLDNTLARYKLKNVSSMIYQAQVEYLVKYKGWSETLRDRYSANQDFMMKGLVYDCEHGNLLKLNSNGEISIATHGTTLLTKSDINKQYPKNKPDFYDQLSKDYKSTTSFSLFENAFDLPSVILCALMVDDFDSNQKSVSGGYGNIWKDVLSSLHHIFDYKSFGSGVNSYFPTVKTHPNEFLDKVDDNVIALLRELKKEGKILFILTSSYVDYSEFVLDHIFGSVDWNELFDLVLYFAKKPSYFVSDHPYYSAEDKKVGDFEHTTLNSGKYSHGNHQILNEYLRRSVKSEKPKIVYFGDSVRSDVFPVGTYTDWKPWCVAEEGMDSEGNLNDVHKRPKTTSTYASPISCPWGSMYRCNDGSSSLWYSIIQKFSPHPVIQQLTEFTS